MHRGRRRSRGRAARGGQHVPGAGLRHVGTSATGRCRVGVAGARRAGRRGAARQCRHVAPSSAGRALGAGWCRWVSHEAAARLHAFDRSLEDPIEFSVLRRMRSRHCAGNVHTTTTVGALDLVTIEGFRCSSATRTVLDLAQAQISTVRSKQPSTARSGSAARRRSSWSVDCRSCVDPGRVGVRLLDRLLIDTGGESVLERRFLQLMRKGGLPRPTTQSVQRRDGRHVGRVDFLFEAAKIVVEVTGRLGHSTAADRTHDAQRRNELIDLGLSGVRVHVGARDPAAGMGDLDHAGAPRRRPSSLKRKPGCNGNFWSPGWSRIPFVTWRKRSLEGRSPARQRRWHRRSASGS